MYPKKKKTNKNSFYQMLIKKYTLQSEKFNNKNNIKMKKQILIFGLILFSH